MQKKRFSALLPILLITITMLAPLVKASPITIDIDPTSGSVGTTVSVWGVSDTSNGDVEIYWDLPGNVLKTVTAVGTSYSTTIEVPESVAGTHAIGAKDVSSTETSAKDFIVESSIVLNPDEGPIGTEVTVSGTGFAKESGVTIELDGIDVTPSGGVTTNDVGSFEATIVVPPVLTGIYDVTAVDEQMNTASAGFLVWGITISIDPSSGPVGTSVAVTGMYATPEETVIIQWDAVDVDEVVAEEDGTYSYSLTVPSATYGVHVIRAIDALSGNEAFEEFFVEPQIVLSVEEGVVGTDVTVTGTGFAGNALVDITYNGDLVVDDFPTTVTGDFETTFSVPASVFNGHTVTATDTVYPQITDSATFSVVPEITIDPTSGPVGTSVDIAGTGFAGDSTVDVYLDRDADGILELADLVLDDVPTNEYGSFSDNFNVPESVYGPHDVVVIDEDDNSATASFTVDPAVITFNSTCGVVGDPVEVLGTGFSGETDVGVYFDNELVLQTTTNEFGSFDGDFYVPWVAKAGVYEVFAIDEHLVTAYTTFVVGFVMYTRSNEYFQGDYPSFFIQSVNCETGEPNYHCRIDIEVYDPDGHLQYYGYAYTIYDGTVPYYMQFYSDVRTFQVFYLPSDALVGTWTWAAFSYCNERWVYDSFKVVERVDLRDVLGKLDELLEGQDDIVGFIVQWGEKLQLEHKDLASLISAVADELSMVHADLFSLIADLSEQLNLTHGDLARLIGDVYIELELTHDDLAELMTFVYEDLEWKIDDLADFLEDVAEEIELAIGDIVFKLDDTVIPLLKAINATIVDLEKKIDGYYLSLNTTIGEIVFKVDPGVFVYLEAIEAKLDFVNATTIRIESAIGDVEVKLDDIGDFLVDIKAEIVDIEEKIDGVYLALNTTLGEIEVKLDYINATLTALDGRLATIETDIGTIQVDIASIDTSITSIEGDIATITTTLGTIEGRITAIEGDIATIKTDIGEIQVDLPPLQETSSAIESTTTLGMSIGSVLSAIAAIAAVAACILIYRRLKVAS